MKDSDGVGTVFSLSRMFVFARSFRSTYFRLQRPRYSNLAQRELPEHAVISTFDLFSIGGASQLDIPSKTQNFI
jgi:hypothetical protein